MTGRECECDQPVALPHCDHTRCPAPAEPVEPDHHDSMAAPNGTGLPVRLMFVAAVMVFSCGAVALIAHFSKALTP